jgi:hypothetical protein
MRLLIALAAVLALRKQITGKEILLNVLVVLSTPAAWTFLLINADWVHN